VLKLSKFVVLHVELMKKIITVNINKQAWIEPLFMAGQLMNIRTCSLFSLYCLMASIHCYGKDNNEPFFNVSPKVCITEAKQTICNFNVHIRFALAPFTELCLEIIGRPQYTQCYKQLGLIEEHVRLQSMQPINIQLIDPQTNKVVKQQQLNIATHKAKDYRIKRRFGWSL